MSRKSQVDKFKARESKKVVDKEAINTRSYQKSQEEVNKYGAEGVGELMKHGNIKEAAVVFSYEGMGAFANMFGNSMESAVIRVLDSQLDKITQTMEQRIEAIVQSKMMEMMEGMTEGMKKFQSEQQQHSSLINVDINLQAKLQEEMNKILEAKEEPQISQVDLIKGILSVEKEAEKEQRIKAGVNPVETPAIDWEKAFAIDEAGKSKTRPKKGDYFSNISVEGIEGLPKLKTGYRYGSGAKDVAIVAPYVLSIFKKYAGKEIMSSEILKVLGQEYGLKIVNPTVSLRKIMALDPNLENTGFGVYKYEEKSFKPTV